MSHVTSIALSPDGRTIASTYVDRPVTLWDAATGREVRRFGAAGAARVGFLPDGAVFASAGSDLEVFDPASGAVRRRVAGITGRPDGSWAPTPVAVSPDGRLAASAKGLFDLASGARVRAFASASLPDPYAGSGIVGLAFPPDAGSVLLVDARVEYSPGDDAGRLVLERIRRHDVSSGAETGFAIELEGYRALQGRHLITEGEKATLHEVGSGALRRCCAVPCNCAIAVSPDGTRVATTVPAGVRLWDAETGREIASLAQGASVTALAFSPDGALLALGDALGTVAVWPVLGLDEGVLRLRGGTHFLEGYPGLEGVRVFKHEGTFFEARFDAAAGRLAALTWFAEEAFLDRLASIKPPSPWMPRGMIPGEFLKPVTELPAGLAGGAAAAKRRHDAILAALADPGMWLAVRSRPLEDQVFHLRHGPRGWEHICVQGGRVGYLRFNPEFAGWIPKVAADSEAAGAVPVDPDARKQLDEAHAHLREAVERVRSGGHALRLSERTDLVIFADGRFQRLKLAGAAVVSKSDCSERALVDHLLGDRGEPPRARVPLEPVTDALREGIRAFLARSGWVHAITPTAERVRFEAAVATTLPSDAAAADTPLAAGLEKAFAELAKWEPRFAALERYVRTGGRGALEEMRDPRSPGRIDSLSKERWWGLIDAMNKPSAATGVERRLLRAIVEARAVDLLRRWIHRALHDSLKPALPAAEEEHPAFRKELIAAGVSDDKVMSLTLENDWPTWPRSSLLNDPGRVPLAFGEALTSAGRYALALPDERLILAATAELLGFLHAFAPDRLAGIARALTTSADPKVKAIAEAIAAWQPGSMPAGEAASALPPAARSAAMDSLVFYLTCVERLPEGAARAMPIELGQITGSEAAGFDFACKAGKYTGRGRVLRHGGGWLTAPVGVGPREIEIATAAARRFLKRENELRLMKVWWPPFTEVWADGFVFAFSVSGGRYGFTELVCGVDPKTGETSCSGGEEIDESYMH